MRYGAYESVDGTKCANCGKIITKDPLLKDNYCSNCGNPLTMESYDEAISREKQSQLFVIKTIKSELKNHSIDKILSDLKDELTN